MGSKLATKTRKPINWIKNKVTLSLMCNFDGYSRNENLL